MRDARNVARRFPHLAWLTEIVPRARSVLIVKLTADAAIMPRTPTMTSLSKSLTIRKFMGYSMVGMLVRTPNDVLTKR